VHDNGAHGGGLLIERARAARDARVRAAGRHWRAGGARKCAALARNRSRARAEGIGGFPRGSGLREKAAF